MPIRMFTPPSELATTLLVACLAREFQGFSSGRQEWLRQNGSAGRADLYWTKTKGTNRV